MNDMELDLIDNYRKEMNRCIDKIEKSNLRLFVISLVSIITVPAVVVFFLIYLYQYDFTTETIERTVTVEQDSGDYGTATYIGGDCSYGETESDNKNKDR